jgi:hypothetical protein
MKIAMQVNGRYVSAEQGGGIDTRDPATPIALVANRPECGPWEIFEIEDCGDGTFALVTAGGYYVTAELGGGGKLRTNATTVGVWEMFRGNPELGLLVTHDGLHLVDALGVGGELTASTVVPRFEVTVLEAAVPPLPDTTYWRGSFCIPGALPGSPFGDGARIWTPAYGCYEESWRNEIRKAYRDRGYTHFVYNAAGLPYAGDYPELADDPNRVQRDLTELRADGLIPVVCCTDDRYPSVVLASVAANAALIPIVFPVWEMNGPLHDEDIDIERDKCKAIIEQVRYAVPDAECWLHFTPGHGAIGLPEDECWRWCQDIGTIGLLGQGGNKISNCDPIYEGKGFETTAVRLLGMCGYVVPDWDGGSVPGAWEGLHQRSVKFEWGIYESYHAHVTEHDLNRFTDQFMTVALHVSGFCDGGTAATA